MLADKVIVFPGQGSQRVGMEADLVGHPVSKAIIQEACEILGFDLLALMRDGPELDLKRTDQAQPALFVCSYALWRVMLDEGLNEESVKALAGHSLGEWTALAAAQVLPWQKALECVHKRGLLMAEAAAHYPGKMAAILGLSSDIFDSMPSFAEGFCGIANDNGGGQVVISGTEEVVAKAQTWAKQQGGRAIPLPVAGAFHSPLMASAEKAFAEVIGTLVFQKPRYALIPNRLAALTTDPQAIKSAVTQQITGSIRWRETMDLFTSLGIQSVVEVGSGRVLKGLLARHLPDTPSVSVQTVKDVKDLLDQQ